MNERRSEANGQMAGTSVAVGRAAVSLSLSYDSMEISNNYNSYLFISGNV